MAKSKQEQQEEKVAEQLQEETQNQKSEPEKKPAKEKGKKADLEKEKLQKERDEYLSLLQRERADFENYKRRNQTAVSEAYQNAMLDAAAKFLPLADNMEYAIKAAGEEDSPIKQGVELIQKQLGEIFASLGIEEIEAQGQQFDPNFHNAVMQAEPEEGEESGLIKEVLMRGYRAGERILRHSMVKVVK
ncbi:nucleotide exchange factor GrpE [Christensenellaceae bacterium 44-20]